MTEFSCATLVSAMAGYVKACGWREEDTLVRISMGSEQERVLRYGTTRAGKSDMPWDKLGDYEPSDLPRWPILHEDVVIASTFDDLRKDAEISDGTLAHKLAIYDAPFATFYSRASMTELAGEGETTDPRNRGRHWLFNGDRLSAMRGVANIYMDGTSQPLQTVSLKGAARLDTRPRRFYFALTNFCNRACELCCCHSDPGRSTFLTFDRFLEYIDCGEPYEAQLEGGEPLLHPDFWRMVEFLMADANCARVVLCTNAVMLPWGSPDQAHEVTIASLRSWLSRFQAKPFLLKPSVNSHLISRDPRHIARMRMLREAFDGMEWQSGSGLLFNVRRRGTEPDGDGWLTLELRTAGLADISNDFLYQRIGRAEDDEGLDRPFIIPDPVRFSLISPDGVDFGCDLLARAAYMKNLP